MRSFVHIFHVAAGITLLPATALSAETTGIKGGEGTGRDIIETVDAAGNFETLIAAVKAAGLEEKLKGDGPFTFLAPSDEAFEQLPAGTLESLLKPENKGRLQTILKYHILPGRTTARELATREIAKTLDSYSVFITSRHPLTFNEKSKVVRPDIRASNGIIHGIDQVLVPADSPEWKRDEMRRKELADLEDYLRGEGIVMNEEGIRKYLVEVTDLERDRVDIKKLILQLGSPQFAERDIAARSLKERQVLPVDLLREATRNPNLEVATRAKAILERYLSQRIQTITKVFLAIELLELPGLTDQICRTVTKFYDAPGIARPARRTLIAVATDSDIRYLSSQMSAESVPPLRHAVICALRQLGHAGSADRFAAWAKEESFAEITRLESALALADLGDRRPLGLLLALMVDAESPSVRARSAFALRTLTGQRFSFYAYANPQSRREEAEAWKQWISASGETAPLNAPLRGIQSTGSLLNGKTLVALRGGPNKVSLFDPAMKEVWSYDSPYPVSAWMMENGNYLIGQLYGPEFIEVTPGKEIVRTRTMKVKGSVDNTTDYEVRTMVNNAQPLPNGNFLVSFERRLDVDALAARAIEVDPDGKIVWELKPRWNSMGKVLRLESGNTLVVENRGSDGIKFVAEYDHGGEIVWEWGSFDSIWSIQALENGNVLLCLRDSGLKEIDPKTQKVVWKLHIEDAWRAYRIDNGNLFVRTGSQFMEVDPEGNEVWSKPH